MMAYLTRIAVGLTLFCALFYLMQRDYWLNLAVYALQSIALFVVFLSERSVLLSLPVILVGFSCALVLFISLNGIGKLSPLLRFKVPNAGEIFRLLTGIFLILASAVIAPWAKVQLFPRVDSLVIFCGLAMMALALLQMGISSDLFFVFLGLLNFFSGFELIYAGLEEAILLQALFVAIQLLLSLCGAYYLIKREEKRTL